MAKRHRPSLPLIILFIILLLLFFLAGPLTEIASSISARGTIKFSFTSNVDDDPVVSIVYTLPQDLADVMVPEQTDGWTVTLAGDILSVADGTLNSGESVTVNYRLKEYIEGGSRAITATATTEKGVTDTTENSLQVPDALLLAIVGMFSSIWLLILAIIVLVIIIVLFIIGNKKDEEQEKTEGKTGPASPQKSG
jgi:hypothetical protein